MSEYLKKNPNKKVIEWLDEQEESYLFISCLTIAELKKGFYKLCEKDPIQLGSKAEKIALWLERIEKRFQNRVLPLNNGTLHNWAKLNGQSEANSKKLPVVDSFLVATALTHNLIAVTYNEADFKLYSKQLEILKPN